MLRYELTTSPTDEYEMTLTESISVSHLLDVSKFNGCCLNTPADFLGHPDLIFDSEIKMPIY